MVRRMLSVGSAAAIIRQICIVLCLAAVAQPAQAQLDEIVVTARRVEENLSEVPLSVTAFSSDQIDAAFIRNLDDVAALTPGLSFFNAQGEFLPVPVIRGISQTDIFGEVNVGIFIDGIYVSGREGLNFSQLDLERIEVVKGPQSALYGRNAFAGSINYVTKRPREEFGAKAEAIAGNDGRQSGQFAVTGPLFTDSLRGRVSMLYDEFDGSYDNSLAPENDLGGFRLRSGHAGLLWLPTESLEIYGNLYYSNDELDDTPQSAIVANCEERGDGRLLNVCGELPGLSGAPVGKLPRALGEDRDLLRATLDIDWDFSFGTFTLLSGFSKTKQKALVDGNRGQGFGLPFIYCTEPFPIPAFCLNNSAVDRLTTGLLQIELEDEVEEESLELRFTSDQSKFLRYTAGGYWYDVDKVEGDGGVEATLRQLPANFVGFGPFVRGIPFPSSQIPVGNDNEAFGRWFQAGGDLDPLGRPVQRDEVDAWALFLGVDYDVTELLTSRFELRYTQERKTSIFNDWNEEDISRQLRDLEQSTAKKNFDQWTGRIGLDYKISDNWMLYGYVAKGEKPGGFSVFDVNVLDPTVSVTPIRIISLVPFDPEEIVAYELGVKGSTDDGRMAIEMSAYLNDWSDIVLRQIVEFDPVSGLPLDQPEAVNVNAASSKVFGFEIDTSVLIIDDLTGRFSVAYSDANLDKARQDTFEAFPSFAPDGDVSGNQLLRNPKWQATASLDYSRAISGEWELYSRGDWTWQDKVFIGNDNQSWLPARGLFNATLGLRSDRYTIELWGRNLFDEDSPSAAYRDVFFTNTDDIAQANPPATEFPTFFPIRYSVSYPRLRTFGITARVRFGALKQ